jgi:hypothetical protein
MRGFSFKKARRIGFRVLFAVVVGAGFVVAFRSVPLPEIAVSAGMAWLVFLMFVLALWDLAAMATRFMPYLSWLPQHRLPPWLHPIRSSFVIIAFMYGIVLGHFWP